MMRARFLASAAPLFAILALPFFLAACGQRDDAPRDADADEVPAAGAAAEYAPDLEGMSQHDAGIAAIFAILSGDLDTIRPHFEEEIRPNLSAEHATILHGQFAWLYDLIGGEFVQHMTGWSLFPDSTPGFFREYRMANETNKRAPFIVIHLVFADSVTPYVAGAQVKNFLGMGQEKRIQESQTWRVGGKDIEIHEVKLVETDSGSMLAVMFFDDNNLPLETQEHVKERGIPVARAAVARGLLDSARTAMPGRTILKDIGVGFIRDDPKFGHTQIKIGFAPEDYLK